MPLTTIPEHRRDPNSRIDLKTWPHTAQIYLNRAAVQDLVVMLQNCLDITAPHAGFCIELKHAPMGTKLEISADDLSSTINPN